MGELVNLRRVKKQRAAAAAAAEVAANRALHGRSRPEKAAEAAVQTKLRLVLDQAKIDPISD